MEWIGTIKGLIHEAGSPLQYTLKVGEEGVIPLNERLGRPLRIEYGGEIACRYCGRITKKSFNNGSCYPCFVKLPQNDMCYIKPEQCHYEQGTCRDAAFGEAYCRQPHVVYLSYTGDVKVGITRADNPLRRWADQGSVRAMVIARTPDRKTAGQLEVELTKGFKDKTNWRAMLQAGNPSPGEGVSLGDIWRDYANKVSSAYGAFLVDDVSEVQLEYPLEGSFPIKSLDLEKLGLVEGTLLGVKGQYLLLDTGVLNIKKFTGYKIAWRE